MPLPALCVLLEGRLLLPMPASVEMLHQAGTAQPSMLFLGLSLGLGYWLLLELWWF